jgi:large subunit ribosomal protein L4
MPIAVKIYDREAQEVGEMKLADNIFGVKTNEALVHQAMVAQNSNMRQVLAHTKDRSEVRGGGRKPWRQKGTGRARAGSSRSPIWIGGGVTFGPTKNRNFKKDINKKMRKKAMMMVLSDRVKSGDLLVLDELKTEEYKTKTVDKILRNLEGLYGKRPVAEKQSGTGGKDKKEKREKNKRVKRNSVVLYDTKSETVKYSGRNLAGVKMLYVDNINLLDLLTYRHLIATKGSIEKIERTYK